MKASAKGLPRPGGFLWRLYGTYVGVVLLSSTVVALLVFQYFAGNARSTMRQHMAQMADLLASLQAANPRELWSPVAQNRVDELARNSAAEIDIALADGSVVASSRGGDLATIASLDLPEFVQARRSGYGEVSRYEEGEDFETVHIVTPIVIRSDTIGYVRVSRSMDHLREEFRRLGAQIALGATVAAGLSMFWGIYFGRFVTRPLNAIKEGCLRISRGDRSLPIDLQRTDEFGVVADTVDDMARSLTREMKQTEQQKNRSELVLRLLHDAVIAIDREGKVAFMNDAAAVYCRCGRPSSCLGRLYSEAVTVEAISEMIGSYGPDDGEFERSIRWREGSGQWNYASVYLSPLKAEEHDLKGVLVVVRDTTERRRFECLRRDFASNVSHELKTPITAIGTLIEALLGGASKDSSLLASFLDRIRLQNDRMRRLVEELLAISKLESGKGMLELKRCDAREAIFSARDTFPSMAAYRGVRFGIHVPEEPLFVNGDLRALEVMANSLVDNALKFTPAGGEIDLSLRTEGLNLCIEVKDTGSGIPREHQERIFERFYRIDSSRTRGRGGSGLGLAIVKHMAIAHGGQVSLDSEEGKGSRFVVTLPLA